MTPEENTAVATEAPPVEAPAQTTESEPKAPSMAEQVAEAVRERSDEKSRIAIDSEMNKGGRRKARKKATTKTKEPAAENAETPETVESQESTPAAETPDSTPETAARPQDAPEKPPAELIRRAMDAGFTEEEAVTYTPDVLTRMVDHVNAAVARAAQGDTQKDTQEQTEKAPEGIRALREFKVKQSKTEEPPQETWDDTDVEDGNWVGTFTEFHKANVEAYDHLLERLEMLESTIGTQVETARKSRMDNWVQSMGEDHAAVLGSGPMSSLHERSKAAMSRQQIEVEADILREGYERRGIPVPSDEQLWARAYRGLFDTQFQTTANGNGLDPKIAERQSKQIARPTRRESITGESPHDRAIDSVEKMLRSKGRD